MLTDTAPATPAALARPAWPNPGRRTEHLLLAAVLLLAGALYGWQVAHAQFHSFYATAVKSMSLSWKAFVYGSLDPAGSITIDKIPGFLWPQALSARVFGFHPWALALPRPSAACSPSTSCTGRYAAGPDRPPDCWPPPCSPSPRSPPPCSAKPSKTPP